MDVCTLLYMDKNFTAVIKNVFITSGFFLLISLTRKSIPRLYKKNNPMQLCATLMYHDLYRNFT